MTSFTSFKQTLQIGDGTTGKKVKDSETDFFANPFQHLFVELNEGRAKYNVLSTNKATKSLMKMKQSFYEQVEKACTLLAWHMKQMETERAIQTDEGLRLVTKRNLQDFFNFL